jgi:pimeloyl-ACP methyl ester carboxylesterase
MAEPDTPADGQAGRDGMKDVPTGAGGDSARGAAPTSHTYFSQRLRLHYLDWGNADAPPLLLIHGNRDHCHNWDWVAARLRDDYHVVAADLRGHGDSQWSTGSTYSSAELVYDIAQLIHQKHMAPLRIVAHSLGGTVALKYAGVFPENVERLVVIEGTGPPPSFMRNRPPAPERLRGWIESSREISGRSPRRYADLDEAYQRMNEANPHLSPEQARHLTIHGSNQNEDGTYSWKFDNYVHVHTPFDLSPEETSALWGNIACPVLLLSGSESWANREDDAGDLVADFRNARHEVVEGAGHWVHHDQLDHFVDLARTFLS